MYLSKKCIKNKKNPITANNSSHLVEITLKSEPLTIPAQSQGKRHTENHESQFQENFL